MAKGSRLAEAKFTTFGIHGKQLDVKIGPHGDNRIRAHWKGVPTFAHRMLKLRFRCGEGEGCRILENCSFRPRSAALPVSPAPHLWRGRGMERLVELA